MYRSLHRLALCYTLLRIFPDLTAYCLRSLLRGDLSQLSIGLDLANINQMQNCGNYLSANDNEDMQRTVNTCVVGNSLETENTYLICMFSAEHAII